MALINVSLSLATKAAANRTLTLLAALEKCITGFSYRYSLDGDGKIQGVYVCGCARACVWSACVCMSACVYVHAPHVVIRGHVCTVP